MEERSNLKSQYELFKDSQIGLSIMPAAWVIAAKYFRIKTKTHKKPQVLQFIAMQLQVLPTHLKGLPSNAERYRQPYRPREVISRNIDTSQPPMTHMVTR